jgi:hypothetical protein
MGFKLKSGNKVDFKMMGSSPVKNMKDGDYSQSFEKSPMRKSPLHEEAFFGDDPNAEKKVVKDPVVTETETKTDDKKTEVTPGNSAGNTDDIYGTKDGSPPTDVADKVADDKEKEKIRAQSKKEMYANAWQNSGIGHIVEAGKSIGRGIKNIRTKNKAKKAEKLASAQEAVGSGTETLKQAKTVDRNRKKTANQEKRKAKSDAKDKKKLAEYRKKNPKQANKKASPAKGGLGLMGSNNLMSDKTKKVVDKYHPVYVAGRGVKKIVKTTAKAAKSTDKALKKEAKTHLKKKPSINRIGAGGRV